MLENVEALFGGSSNLLSLIRLIYESVESPMLWHTVMERIAETIDGQWTVLWPSYSHPAETAITSWARLDPAVLPPYAEYYASVNVIAQRIEEAHPKTLISYSHRVISDHDLEQSEYYNDYLKPNGLFYTFGMTIDLGLEAPSVISSLRSKAAGPFGDREGLILSTLMPHLQQALRLNLQLGHLRSKSEGLEIALNAFDVAVFGLNPKGTVVFQNQAALQIAQIGDGLVLAGGKLSAVQSTQNTRLQTLLTQTVDTGNGRACFPGGSMLLNCKSTKPPLRLTIVPLATSSFSPDLGQVMALVFVSDSSRIPRSRSATLRVLYGLSPTEAKLTDCLVAGMELKDIAVHLRLSENTARFHLEEVFRKSGVRSQSALIRLIVGLPGAV